MSSTLGGPEHKMDHWLEPGWQFGAPHAAGQLPEEAACRAERFSDAIHSYTRHSYSAPFLLTKHPLGLLLSFSSFLKAAASQESPSLWHSTEGQASQLSCTLPFARPLPGSPVPPIHSHVAVPCPSSCRSILHCAPHTTLPGSHLPQSQGEGRVRQGMMRARGTRGCGPSEALGYCSIGGK